MDKKKALIDKLDKATDRAVSVALVRGYPLALSKRSTMIGTTIVEKNTKGFYNISTVDGHTLYEDISVFDVAVIIAQRYNAGEPGVIKKVLALEERYAKYHSDMINYLHCFKGAKKRHDIERMAILEDKFQVSEMLAKSIRDHISIFKRTK
jgi:hypothetical protein